MDLRTRRVTLTPNLATIRGTADGDSTSMTGYKAMLLEDLIKSAKFRQVFVPASGKSGKPRKRDYVKALQDFDSRVAAQPFRFMDLSPELRTLVYRELLTFKRSWTCYPQILSTSKQVHGEAESILYGDNLIEVKIWPDTIQAHGKRCGAYTPLGRGGWGTDDSLDAIRWPDMLRKIQWVRVSIPPGITLNDYYVQPRRWQCTVQQILYSLCNFLSSENLLRSAEIDFRQLSLERDSDEYASFTWPLTMLGPLKEKVLKLSDSKTVDATGAAAAGELNISADPSVLPNALSLYKQAMRYDDITRQSLANRRSQVFTNALFDLEDRFDRRIFFDSAWEEATSRATERMERTLEVDAIPFLEQEEVLLQKRSEEVAGFRALLIERRDRREEPFGEDPLPSPERASSSLGGRSGSNW